MAFGGYHDTIDPDTKEVIAQPEVKEHLLDLYQQDFDLKFGALTREEMDTIHRRDYIRSRFIIRWIMLIGEDQPPVVREQFEQLSMPCRSQMLRFLEVMQHDLWYDWRLRIFSLGLRL